MLKNIIISIAVWILEIVLLAIGLSIWNWEPVSISLVKPAVWLVGGVFGFIPAVRTFYYLQDYDNILVVYDGKYLSVDDPELRKAVKYYNGEAALIMKHFRQNLEEPTATTENIRKAIRIYNTKKYNIR